MQRALIDMTAFDDLASRFRGELICPDDPSYETARQVFNAMIDRRPAVIARCTGTVDVLVALRFAQDRRLGVAVRGGGHSVAGYGVCDGGMVVDLSPMKGIRVDPDRRTARAQAGVTWGELDRETQAFGLATTGGRISSTGIAGLTLGAGSGWLERKYGLACDNLLSAQVVTADGRVLTASITDRSDLFWGLRGGGGNFGIVTEFEYRLYPVGPTIFGGMLIYPIERAREVLRVYRDFMATAPDEVGGAAGIVTAPPDPALPIDLHGTPIFSLQLLHTGEHEEAEASFEPLRTYGPPRVDLLGPMPYTAFQRLLDPACPPGQRNYWKSESLDDLTDPAIDTFVDRVGDPISPFSQMIIEPKGGALTRVGEHDTAYGPRAPGWHYEIFSVWDDPTDDDQQIAWTQAVAKAMQPHTTGTAYLNYIGDEGNQRVRSSFGPEKYRRLVALKKAYDPGNVFRLNQNILPS